MIYPEQKYKIGQHVEVRGWVGKAKGTVKHIQWIYHDRLYEWTWGYFIEYDNGITAGLTLQYVPEGYLGLIEGDDK